MDKKLTPDWIGYDPSAYSIPDEMRKRLREAYPAVFADNDFARIEDSLSCAESTWRALLNAPYRGRVAECLQKISAASLELTQLVDPNPSPEPGPNEVAAKEASERIRLTYWDQVLQDETRRDGITVLLQALRFLSTAAKFEREQVLSEKTTGSRTLHLRRLLSDLTSIFENHGLPVSYTTDISTSKRQSMLAEFAFDVAQLLPREARPQSIGALINQLVKLRAEHK